jgi:putative membrane protein
MHNKITKTSIWVAILFEIILIITGIVNALSRQYSNLLFLLWDAICIIIPFIIVRIANAKKIALPSSFLLAVLIFIFLTLYLGETMKFYDTFWWWDLFLHGIFGIYGVIIGFHLSQGIINKDKNITKKRFSKFTLLFAFCFTITIGTLWEIYEFLADYFFKTDMTNGSLEDTATDLLIKITCAFITSIIYYHFKLKKEHKINV